MLENVIDPVVLASLAPACGALVAYHMASSGADEIRLYAEKAAGPVGLFDLPLPPVNIHADSSAGPLTNLGGTRPMSAVELQRRINDRWALAKLIEAGLACETGLTPEGARAADYDLEHFNDIYGFEGEAVYDAMMLVAGKR